MQGALLKWTGVVVCPFRSLPTPRGPGLAFSTSLNHGGTAPLMPLSGTLAGGFGGFPTSNETSARLPQGLAGRLALKVQAKLDGFASALYERPLGAPMLRSFVDMPCFTIQASRGRPDGQRDPLRRSAGALLRWFEDTAHQSERHNQAMGKPDKIQSPWAHIEPTMH
ncbi:hypothetical protein DHEL01_v212240 [Diaporthe helianthi]|uniref:Uncharacterized protein n=1 Tax=Diaporthe helianthi TaxID=158607 RepID=A0A2P5HGJ1_DIAHE|nr:hypothetical protein DHEL01_v212240 [Diaporthe helianthi]